jgi:hypothetical protein
MTTRRLAATVLAFGVIAGAAVAQKPNDQEPNTADDIQQGHWLAVIICSNCHIAARDQPLQPILRPPAPSFESLAQRSSMSGDFVQSFLAGTHRDMSNRYLPQL